MRQITLLASLLFVIVFAFSCKDKLTEITLTGDPPPTNPFDTIDYNPNNFVNQPIDSTTFAGLHYYIFSSSCNRSGCHDGTFEPDFRTIQSAYNTLVKHPVSRNYPAEPLPFRVTPGAPDLSMMYRRITIHDPDFELMPSSGSKLPDREIELIRQWIEDGAPDIFGNLPNEANLTPVSPGLLAYLPGDNDARIDDDRNSTYSPFNAPFDKDIHLWFAVVDDVNILDMVDVINNVKLGNTLTYNKMKLSDNPYNFDNAVELDLDVPLIPKIEPFFFGEPFPLQIPHYQNIVFNPADYGFESGDLVFMRFYVQDDDHVDPTEIPTTSSQQFLHTYYSFYLQ